MKQSMKHQRDFEHSGQETKRPPMSAQRRFLFLTLIMIAASGVVMMVMTVMLYRHDIEEHENRLEATVRSQARLIEAIARPASV